MILLGKSWPYYYIELYNTSPIPFQRNVLRRLERIPTAAGGLELRIHRYDTVPHVVRVPLAL